ncbi:methylated-DNA--[protein]-cysteine S-methyltransferase [Allocoprobacillus halotolerans]|uniref:Methylated-DNA--[protein]-cysteine S-methyltransferase n=1 Tax=Allocoprobacillus halotolerans TaxID=2944914 RepID=A0ABY5I4Z1_9FIRM|nr:methylated-DNA--[protein]-cysteine S-methyltransferase [Allocoprobacillus halotolerans]UTY39030.1 methylated-DNA--[protein]-cysteine S-methyltransferase [Allocoprobacillus halotolerans]
MSSIYYYEYSFPIGKLMLACQDNHIIYCGSPIEIKDAIYEKNKCLEDISKQIYEYFDKTRINFDFQYRFVKGTAFQQKVWKATMSIPYGTTKSYQEVAQMIGHPRAYRAVGSALRECPFSLLIPCHRVIGSSHKLGGYGRDMDIKLFLLHHENPDLVSF